MPSWYIIKILSRDLFSWILISVPKSTLLLDVLEQNKMKEIPVFYFLCAGGMETQRWSPWSTEGGKLSIICCISVVFLFVQDTSDDRLLLRCAQEILWRDWAPWPRDGRVWRGEHRARHQGLCHSCEQNLALLKEPKAKLQQVNTVTKTFQVNCWLALKNLYLSLKVKMTCFQGWEQFLGAV